MTPKKLNKWKQRRKSWWGKQPNKKIKNQSQTSSTIEIIFPSKCGLGRDNESPSGSSSQNQHNHRFLKGLTQKQKGENKWPLQLRTTVVQVQLITALQKIYHWGVAWSFDIFLREAWKMDFLGVYEMLFLKNCMGQTKELPAWTHLWAPSLWSCLEST